MFHLLAFDFSDPKVVTRLIGLLAVLVLFVSFAYLEYAGKPPGKVKPFLYILMTVCGVGLIYSLVKLKGA